MCPDMSGHFIWKTATAMKVKTEQQAPLLYAACACLMVAWTLPNHNQPWSTAYQDFAAFLSCLFFLFALTLAPKKALPASLLPFFLLPLIPLLQLAFQIIYFSGDAWIAAIYLVGFALMLLAGYNLGGYQPNREFCAQLISGTFVAAALLSSWIALRQWLLISDSIWEVDIAIGARPYANLAQANNFATLLCLGLAGIAYFYQTAKVGRLAACLTCLTLLFCLALTQSRTPWVTLLAVIIFWHWKSTAPKVRILTANLISWVFIYLLFVFALPYISEWLVLSSTSLLTRATSMERWDLWQQFWHAAWDCPLWGCGWNQAGVAQVNASLTHPLALPSEHSHNILLDLLLWNGIPLGTLLILLIGGWLARLAWMANSTESLFALICSGFIIGHGLLEYPLEYAFYLLPLGLLLGLAAAERSTIYELDIPCWLPATVLLLGVLLFGLYWKEYRILEEDHRLLRFESARIGSVKAEQPAPDVFMITQLREQIRFFRTPITGDLSEADLEQLRKIAYRYPNPTTLYRYSLALGLNGRAPDGYNHLLILRNLYGNERYLQSLDSLLLESKQHPMLSEMLKDAGIEDIPDSD
jgi:hypothetical protein